MKKLSSTLPNMLLSLTIICVVVAGILSGLNYLTLEPIEQAQIKAKNEAISQVTPEFDNDPFAEKYEVSLDGEEEKLLVYPAKKGGEVVGYAIETYTKAGFSGRISIMMGVDKAGKMVDFSVLEISETPGLGSLIPEWFHAESQSGGIRNMRGIDLKSEHPMKVRQDGGKVDAITAATISSRAFLDALDRGYRAYLKIESNPTND